MIKKRAFILAFLGIIFSVIAYLLLALQYRYQLRIFLAGLLTSEVVRLLSISAMICFCISIHMILKYLRERYLKLKILTIMSSFIVTTISVILCLIIIFVGIMNETHRLVLKSPDGEHTIVVSESYSWHHGSGTFYEKVNPLFVIPVGSFSFDDIELPFTNGEYTVEWLEDGGRIKYLAKPPKVYEEKRLYYLEEKFDNYIEDVGD